MALFINNSFSGHLTPFEAQYLYNQIRLYLFEEAKYKVMRVSFFYIFKILNF